MFSDYIWHMLQMMQAFMDGLFFIPAPPYLYQMEGGLCLNKQFIVIAARCCVNIIQFNPYNLCAELTLSAPFLCRRARVLKVIELVKSHPTSEHGL